jgi:hypothetical protein
MTGKTITLKSIILSITLLRKNKNFVTKLVVLLRIIALVVMPKEENLLFPTLIH